MSKTSYIYDIKHHFNKHFEFYCVTHLIEANTKRYILGQKQGYQANHLTDIYVCKLYDSLILLYKSYINL